MADKKISELVSITGSATAADDYFVVVDTSGAVTYKISREELNNAIEQDVLSSIEITDITNDVNVQGTVTADGLTVDGTAQIGSDTAKVKFYSDSTYSGIFNGASLGSNENFYMGAGSLFFYGGGSERMRIDSSGNVGIGTSSPNSYAGYTALTLNHATNGGIIDIERNGTLIGEIFTDDVNTFTLQAVGSKSVNFRTSGSERMRIDSSGNVGIGTSSPNYKLQVHDSGSTSIIQLSNGTSGSGVADGFHLISYLDEARLVHREAGPMIFFTNAAERMRIDSSGDLLVGTTTANDTERLSVLTDTDVAISTRVSSASNFYSLLIRNSSQSTIGSVYSTTTTTSFNTSSDYRLKTAVNYDWDATSRLKQLKPARFKWIADGDDAVPVDGFLAHEVSHDSDGNPLVPEAITGTKDAMRDEEYEVTPAVLDEDGNEVTPAVMGTRSVPDYQGIDQSKLTPLLTKALIEAVEKIEQLEARIVALEAN